MASIYLGSLAPRQPAGFQQIQNHSANLIDLLTFFIQLDEMHFNHKMASVVFILTENIYCANSNKNPHFVFA